MTIRPFLASEDGAVTVDWVVLTAVLVGLGVAVTAGIGSGFRAQSTAIQVQLARDDILCTDFCDRTTGFVGRAEERLSGAGAGLPGPLPPTGPQDSIDPG